MCDSLASMPAMQLAVCLMARLGGPGQLSRQSVIPDRLVMVALWNRADHYIFVLWFLLSFFPRLISAVADWMSAILPHMVWP